MRIRPTLPFFTVLLGPKTAGQVQDTVERLAFDAIAFLVLGPQPGRGGLEIFLFRVGEEVHLLHPARPCGQHRHVGVPEKFGFRSDTGAPAKSKLLAPGETLLADLRAFHVRHPVPQADQGAGGEQVREQPRYVHSAVPRDYLSRVTHGVPPQKTLGYADGSGAAYGPVCAKSNLFFPSPDKSLRLPNAFALPTVSSIILIMTPCQVSPVFLNENRWLTG